MNSNQKTNYSNWLLPVIISLLLIGIFFWQEQKQKASLTEWLNKTTVTQTTVIEKVQAVAKLVSSETVLRDVVIYENTWYGSTKRSLVVVSGKLLAGIDLESGKDVKIDDKAHKITITIPQAKILAIEITDIKTYDEQQGFWNPFQASDRDAIYKLAREKFKQTGQEMNIVDHANKSAKQLLETMFSTNGYQAEVIFSTPPLIKN